MALPPFCITRLRLENFRQFESLDLEFGSRFNVIVGPNGSGKSTLLEALSVSLDEWIPYHPGGWTFPFEEESIRSTTTIVDGIPYEVQAQGTEIRGHGRVLGLDASWGRSIRGERPAQSNSAVKQYCSLLSNGLQVGDAQEHLAVIAAFGNLRMGWRPEPRKVLKEADSIWRAITNSLRAEKDFSYVLDFIRANHIRSLQARLLKSEKSILEPWPDPLPLMEAVLRKLLPGCDGLAYHLEQEELYVKVGSRVIPLRQASTGYLQIIMIAFTLVWKAFYNNRRKPIDWYFERPGVVIIDEIDAHLHPEWQRRVIYDLMTTFPNIQFFVTTHSPFIIQGLPRSESTRIIRLGEDPESLMAEHMSLEDVATYVQGVDEVERGYYVEQQGGKIAAALADARNQARGAGEKIDDLLQTEALDPASRALLELNKLGLSMKQEVREERQGYGDSLATD